MILPASVSRQEALQYYHRAHMEAAERDVLNEVRRQLALGDLFYLLAVVLNRPDVNHDWLYARCREVERAPDGYLDLWARDHYKSTIITYALTIQDILKDPELTVGIFSFNRPTAKKFLFQIKEEFANNEDLKVLFTDILWDKPETQAPKWSEDDGIIVKRKSNKKEATIEAWGLVEAQPTSRHFMLMVYDDVITDKCVTNADMIETVTRAWETSRALGTEGGRTRYIGTRWHTNDTYRAIIDRKAAFPRCHQVTVDGSVDGVPVFRSKEWVAEKYKEMGPYTFSAQMLLDPSADKVQGFKYDWLRYYQSRSDGDFSRMNKYILVDAANEKKKGSDYTAMGVVGLGDDENYYLLDGVRDRLSLTERGDALFALHRRWKPKGVGYEEYGLMGDIQYVEDRQARENYRFEITKLGGRLAKPDRIRRLIPVFEGARFHLPESLIKVDYEGRHQDLVQVFINEEYRDFPVALHDDFFDMLSRIVDPGMGVIWPKSSAPPNGDRYARSRERRRPPSFMAA